MTTQMRLELTSLGGDVPDDLMVGVYLYGEFEPRLELPVLFQDGEAVEDAARRSLRVFARELLTNEPALTLHNRLSEELSYD